MTDAKEWRPSVGERVAIYGVVKGKSCTNLFRVAIDNGFLETQPFYIAELSPLPAPPSPRPAWEVLRDAAEVLDKQSAQCSVAWAIRQEASRLEAAAAPKPPTLAEAVRAYFDASTSDGVMQNIVAMREALAREEGK